MASDHPARAGMFAAAARAQSWPPVPTQHRQSLSMVAMPPSTYASTHTGGMGGAVVPVAAPVAVPAAAVDVNYLARMGHQPLTGGSELAGPVSTQIVRHGSTQLLPIVSHVGGSQSMRMPVTGNINHLPLVPLSTAPQTEKDNAHAFPVWSWIEDSMGLEEGWTCMQGHSLKLLVTGNNLFSCDICRELQPHGSAILACQFCEYDVCASCAGEIRESRLEAARTVRARADVQVVNDDPPAVPEPVPRSPPRAALKARPQAVGRHESEAAAAASSAASSTAAASSSAAAVGASARLEREKTKPVVDYSGAARMAVASRLTAPPPEVPARRRPKQAERVVEIDESSVDSPRRSPKRVAEPPPASPTPAPQPPQAVPAASGKRASGRASKAAAAPKATAAAAPKATAAAAPKATAAAAPKPTAAAAPKPTAAAAPKATAAAAPKAAAAAAPKATGSAAPKATAAAAPKAAADSAASELRPRAEADERASDLPTLAELKKKVTPKASGSQGSTRHSRPAAASRVTEDAQPPPRVPPKVVPASVPHKEVPPESETDNEIETEADLAELQKQAAIWIARADAMLVRDAREGDKLGARWPGFQVTETTIQDMWSTKHFREEPRLAWAFWQWRANHSDQVAKRRPDPKLLELPTAVKKLADKAPLGAFARTTDVDGIWRKLEWSSDRLMETAGDAKLLQCSSPGPNCPAAWEAPEGTELGIYEPSDETIWRAVGPLPRCPECAAPAWPAVRLKGESEEFAQCRRKRTADKVTAFTEWLQKLEDRTMKEHLKVVCLDLSTRSQDIDGDFKKALLTFPNARLIRIGPEFSRQHQKRQAEWLEKNDKADHVVNLPMDATEAVTLLHGLLGFQANGTVVVKDNHKTCIEVKAPVGASALHVLHIVERMGYTVEYAPLNQPSVPSQEPYVLRWQNPSGRGHAFDVVSLSARTPASLYEDCGGKDGKIAFIQVINVTIRSSDSDNERRFLCPKVTEGIQWCERLLRDITEHLETDEYRQQANAIRDREGATLLIRSVLEEVMPRYGHRHLDEAGLKEVLAKITVYGACEDSLSDLLREAYCASLLRLAGRLPWKLSKEEEAKAAGAKTCRYCFRRSDQADPVHEGDTIPWSSKVDVCHWCPIMMHFAFEFKSYGTFESENALVNAVQSSEKYRQDHLAFFEKYIVDAKSQIQKNNEVEDPVPEREKKRRR